MAQGYVKLNNILTPLTSVKQICHVWIGTKLAYDQQKENLPNNILVIFKEELGDVVPDPTFPIVEVTKKCKGTSGEFEGWYKTLVQVDLNISTS